MPKISIIVPVYNVEKYLRRCLESLIHQSEREIEIIVVDDCSTDGSREIIEEYEKKDERIVYIKHRANRRQGGARNTGLEMAKGEYVWFVDSDDFVDTNACRLLYATAKADELDILGFNMTKVEAGVVIYDYTYRFRRMLRDVMRGSEYFLSYLLRRELISVCCPSYIFRSEIIKKFRFRENVICEDIDFSLLVIQSVGRVKDAGYSPYYRFVRPGSTMTSSKKINILRAKEEAFYNICRQSKKTSFLWFISFFCWIFFRGRLWIS